MRSSSLAIETAGLTKTYGMTRAVAELDLSVEPAAVFGFLGPNGAGKTTTIRMLLGLQRPSAGRCSVLGKDPWSEGTQIRRQVGYLPGDLELFPRLSGAQHLSWFARARGMTDRSYMDELIERFEVTTDRPVRELSKGNRQKIGLVLAFMHRPRLLVLDEPTAGLDPLKQNEFEALVGETVEEGRTIFLSSHELDEVQRTAQRVAIIKAGRIVATDTVEGLRRAAPQKVEVRFARTVCPSDFEGTPGVRVLHAEGESLSLEVTGEIGPVLKLIADRDPVDLLARHADLDELFLDLYREPQGP